MLWRLRCTGRCCRRLLASARENGQSLLLRHGGPYPSSGPSRAKHRGRNDGDVQSASGSRGTRAAMQNLRSPGLEGRDPIFFSDETERKVVAADSPCGGRPLMSDSMSGPLPNRRIAWIGSNPQKAAGRMCVVFLYGRIGGLA